MMQWPNLFEISTKDSEPDNIDNFTLKEVILEFAPAK